MANPITPDTLLKILRDEGVTVVEYKDWRTHNRDTKGPWGPINGVMIHHTVTSGIPNSVELCYSGHSTLPGPLCHGVIDKAGVVHMVGHGRTNHAGGGDPAVLNQVIVESYGTAPTRPTRGNADGVDGNAHFFGFECINLGDGKDPWPDAQVESIIRTSAAIARHYGWTEKSAVGHLEWSDDKIDPKGLDMVLMRARIALRLEHLANWNNSSEEDNMALTTDDIAKIATEVEKRLYAGVWLTDKVPAPADAADIRTNPTWAAQSVLTDLQTRVRNLTKAVAGLSTQLSELSKADMQSVLTQVETAVKKLDIDGDGK